MQQVTRRAWRRLSTDAFASDLAASELCGDLTALGDQTVDELVQLYNQVMTALLDRHCPTVTVRRRVNKKKLLTAKATHKDCGRHFTVYWVVL